MCQHRWSYIGSLIITAVILVVTAVPISQSSNIQFPWNVHSITLTVRNTSINSLPHSRTNLFDQNLDVTSYQLMVHFDYCTIMADQTDDNLSLLDRERLRFFLPGQTLEAYLFKDKCILTLYQANYNYEQFLVGVILCGVALYVLLLMFIEYQIDRRHYSL